MGVQGLWELLAPVGRRVSVETLAGKKLAIDASIWMVQFMKAMRDDKGEMVLNAHLLGFFRRICKLLFLRTKPVFVFDGATPALKRRTVAARRRHRDNARAKIRKTAEKLLLNHLKTKRLEELAAEITKQKEGSKEKQITEEDTKGKKVLDSNDEIGAEGCSVLPSGDMESGVSSHKNLDELLAASLAAEEEMEINKNVLTSEGGLDEAEVDNDENEEMIFPIESIHLDPAVLASLPPSMQLDLLVQMRESIMAENRQKYQKIKKAPTKFSELQIQSYLKTIAFRREIDEVQKCAAGRGIAGVQTSRIASEANREFIFSSSFTGDKQVLASRGVNSGNGDHYSLAKQSTSGSGKGSLLSSQPKLVKEVSVSKHVKDFGPDVETYCDENGRVRVSRVKGLGIHMTRDLQRNLDLMEKYEQEKRRGDNSSDLEASHTKKVVDVSEGLSGNNRSPSVVTSNEGKGETFTGKSSSLPLDRRGHMDELTIHGNEDAIEISFSEDDSGMKATDDDNIFMQLVSGGQTANLPLDCVHSDKSTNDSESDCSWEEGLVKEISEVPNGCADITASPKIDLKKNQSSLAESSYEVAVVDWEEGVSQNPDTSSQFLDKPVKDVSRGTLEEEADIQEAIRRSLGDFKEQHSSTNSSAATELERSMEDRISDGVILHKLVTNTCVHLDNAEESPSCNDGQLDNPCKEDDLQIPDCSKNNLDSYNLSGLDLDGESSLISRREDEQNVMTSQRGNIPPGKPSDGRPSWLEQSLDASYDVQTKSCSIMSMEELCEVRPDTSTKITDDGSKVVGSLNLDGCHISRSSVSPERGYNDSLSGNSSLMEEVIDTGMKSQQNAEKNNVISDHIGYSAQISLENQMEVSEASLDKEISLLRQERVYLGNEQRMLERDAESVNNEMFAECQELLQMFGLPYIIAPTEAEAQCAYMEMTNLVDGVVTDDSDVFLFGARSVYKNIFDDRKYVETYFVKDIECELGLDRDKLIRMALLLGSDYTEGVSGIGIVNAIEVIHAFPEEDGLQKFRQWVESPDPAILGKLITGSHSNRRSLKENNNGADAIRKSSQGDASEESVSRGHDDEKPTGNEAIKDIFIDKHRNVSKNWHIPPSFPSEMVISAYTSPQVDESTEPFMWGKPDLPLLRNY
ncbi:hypothetical protein OPV22_030839 [Ensete ventricosum]|uniref:DNA repair protein UVH3 n=1 Tax=Ensete ventricosum TaxID=4639 RepID=A0AAV8PMY2_ENSVE|nr:hypothetical protein OPV22_030839 [Ensete ventricosum]